MCALLGAYPMNRNFATYWGPRPTTWAAIDTPGAPGAMCRTGTKASPPLIMAITSSALNGLPACVLVCAPTEAAVDSIEIELSRLNGRLNGSIAFKS